MIPVNSRFGISSLLSAILWVLSEQRHGYEERGLRLASNDVADGARIKMEIDAKYNNDDCEEVALASIGDRYLKGSVQCEGDVCVGASWTDHSLSGVMLGREEVAMTCRHELLQNIARVGNGLYEHHRKTTKAIPFKDTQVSKRSYPSPSRRPETRSGTVTVQRHEEEKVVFKNEGGLRVSLFYHRNSEDKRVRVQAEFLNQGNPTKYSLLFDTGSNESYARIRGENCEISHGYHDERGITQSFQRELRFGTIAYPHSVRISRKVGEQIALDGWPSPLTFPITMGLTAVCSKTVDTGLLGAGRGTPFSKAAGTFAYLPSSPRSVTSAGTLLIGPDHDWNSRCKEGTRTIYMDVVRRLSRVHWIVNGAAIARSSDRKVIKGVYTNWVVDTGAYGLHVPSSIYDDIVNMIRLTGSDVHKSDVPKEYPYIDNCYENHSKFPIVYLQIGTGLQKLAITLRPTDYTGSLSRSTGKCQLLLSNSELKNMPNTYLLGEKILRRTLTVFSELNQTVGICLLRV